MILDAERGPLEHSSLVTVSVSIKQALWYILTEPAGRIANILLLVDTTTLRIPATMGGSRTRSAGWGISVFVFTFEGIAYL